MNNRPRLAVLGAVDRYNYGDLLFPVVLHDAFARLGIERQLNIYAIRESDLSAAGALPTFDYRQLARDIGDGKVDALVLAGGEMLGAGWSTMLMYLGSPATARVIKAARRALSKGFLDKVARRLVRAPSPWPWVLAPEDLPVKVPVAYNAVGGITALARASRSELHALVGKLAAADYLAVRDSATAELLAKHGLQGVRLTPDSAIVISDLYPLERLRQLVRPRVEELASGAPYLCLQVNATVGRAAEATISSEIDRLAADTGLRAVLLPIGRAAGHEDQVPLQEVARRSRTDAVTAGAGLTIFEVMYLIASSRVFAGTSLHGAITALSYDRPHVAISGRVPKLLAHLETWSLPEFRDGVEPEQLATAVAAALTVPQARIGEYRQVATATAWEHLARLGEVVG